MLFQARLPYPQLSLHRLTTTKNAYRFIEQFCPSIAARHALRFGTETPQSGIRRVTVANSADADPVGRGMLN